MKKPVLVLKCKKCGKRSTPEPDREIKGRVVIIKRTCKWCQSTHESVFGASTTPIAH